MSCSKIFSGDLPELAYEIIKYFQDDFPTLYSCILVNRLWCRLTIPLLWKDPFSISTGNYKFIGIYLNNLKGDLKTKLNDYEIDKLLPLNNTLFNYPSFIKYLNTKEIITSIEKWFEISVGTLIKFKKRYFIKNAYLNLKTDFKRLIHMSLFKIFIENEVNLHTFEIEVTLNGYSSYFNDIFELILQNTNFIHNIKYLKLYTGRTPSFLYFNETNDDKLTKDHILKLINLHQNLKKVVLDNKSFPLYQSLLSSSKISNSICSNTLNTIILYCINFQDIINLDNVFDQLNVLESIHLIYCYPLNTGFIQQILNLTKPFKLKSLIINYRSQIDESLHLLLQKFGDYLENFGYCNYDLLSKQKLLESIMKYCKNIKLLDLHEYEIQIIHPILNLIENINQNLNYLSINIFQSLISNSNITEYIKYSSLILQNLGQILPFKLEYLSLILHIKEDNFEFFLKNSQNTFIKKLLINNKDGDDILPSIKEYIMKKKRVKYLSIKNSSYKYLLFNNEDLFYLKGEVEEFNSYNIKVQNYDDSIIKVYNYLKKSD
ncbi:hypothetical protein RhiirB3_433570 [Rhizophagus irregularis]|nr:hypothetical protein RhiirB3_433570 [Rhizophagus irregularis]